MCVCIYMIPDSPIAPNSSREIIGVRFHQESCIQNLKKKIHNRKKIRFRFLRVRFHKESCIKNLEKKSDSTNRKQKSDSALRTLLHIGLYINMFSHCICIYNTHILCIYNTHLLLYSCICIYECICIHNIRIHVTHIIWYMHSHCICIYNTLIIYYTRSLYMDI
jgi:hypothetical protein